MSAPRAPTQYLGRNADNRHSVVWVAYGYVDGVGWACTCTMAMAWHNYAAQMNNVPLAPVTTDAVDPAKASNGVASRSAAAVGTHTWRYIIDVSCVDALRLTCQWGVAMRMPSRHS